MITSILFDIDDTIYNQMEPFSAACHAFPALKNADLQALYAARSVRGMEALHSMEAGHLTLEENHIYRMQMACQDLGISFSASDALRFQAIYAEAQEHLQTTASMIAVLDFCKESGFFLGIITNGPSSHQRKKFSILGLERWFPPAHVLVSGDCGWLKPDPQIFQLAQRQWKLTPNTTLYVGDSFAHDILGAQAVGWQSFWLNRRSNSLPAQAQAPSAQGLEAELLSYLKTQRKPAV